MLWSAARSLASIASRSGGSARMSGPSLRTRLSSSSSTGPFQSTASFFSPRSTSHGVPRRVPSFRCRSCQRPFMRRWLRRTSPPSKRRSRFLPTASTRTSRRPSRRLRDSGHARPRMRRLDLELLADERLEAAGRAMERVALGHSCKRMHLRWRGQRAGAVAAIVWGAARAGRPAALPDRTTRTWRFSARRSRAGRPGGRWGLRSMR